jgi:hypothetical protein
MCHYITATLPNAVEPNSVAPIFGSHKLGFKLISNLHVSQQLDSGDWYILTTKEYCDCGTALGSLNRQSVDKVATYERDLEKFRKLGWSEAKIQRWLEQKRQTKERHQREDESRAQGGAQELDRWVAFLNELLKSGHARRFGLLLHSYQGSIESEPIHIQRREKLRLADLNPERLMKVEEDVLYEVVP